MYYLISFFIGCLCGSVAMAFICGAMQNNKRGDDDGHTRDN